MIGRDRRCCVAREARLPCDVSGSSALRQRRQGVWARARLTTDRPVPWQLTKVHEEFWRGTLGDAASEFARSGRAKGEVTLLIAGAGGVEGDASSEAADRASAKAAGGPGVEEQLTALMEAGESPSNVRAAVLLGTAVPDSKRCSDWC